MVISPATRPWPAALTASLDNFTSLLFMSSRSSASPYSLSFILLHVKVGAYRISVPAFRYATWRSNIICGCSSIHFSGHTPRGMPAFIRFVPVAPSSISILSSNSFLKSVFFMSYLLVLRPDPDLHQLFFHRRLRLLLQACHISHFQGCRHDP